MQRGWRRITRGSRILLASTLLLVVHLHPAEESQASSTGGATWRSLSACELGGQGGDQRVCSGLPLRGTRRAEHAAIVSALRLRGGRKAGNDLPGGLDEDLSNFGTSLTDYDSSEGGLRSPSPESSSTRKKMEKLVEKELEEEAQLDPSFDSDGNPNPVFQAEAIKVTEPTAEQEAEWERTSELSEWDGSIKGEQPTARDAHKAAVAMRKAGGYEKRLHCNYGFDEAPDVLVVGGTNGTSDLALVHGFNAQRRAWRTEMSMGFQRDGASAVSVRGKVYVLGGTQNERFLSTVESFDSATGGWTLEPEMLQERCFGGAAVVHNRIYVVGGCDGHCQCLDTVESFDPREGKWRREPSMLTSRGWLGVAKLNGRIYATGGQDWDERRLVYNGNALVTKRVESFDPRQPVKRWLVEPRLRWPRQQHALVSCGGRLYALGGYDQANVALREVECFDPVNNAWVETKPMFLQRGSLAAVSVGGGIFVFGGSNDDRTMQSSVEFFDPTHERWRAVPSMPCVRAGIAAAVVCDSTSMGD